ncbi:MAG: N-6 DNA methylase [Myxococcales bacterium]|nr:N-6 DNA methylase [Myxococcales bacterium]
MARLQSPAARTSAARWASKIEALARRANAPWRVQPLAIDRGDPILVIFAGDRVIGVLEPDDAADRQAVLAGLPGLAFVCGDRWRFEVDDALVTPTAALRRLAARGPEQPVRRDLAATLAARCRLLRAAIEVSRREAGATSRALVAAFAEHVPEVGQLPIADAIARAWTCARLGSTLVADALADPLARACPALARALAPIEAAPRELAPALALIEPVIAAWAREPDPWEGPVEAFLAALDGARRRDAGAFYTPRALVHAQVALTRAALCERLGAAGFADPKVTLIDPACGTGAYPMAALASALTERGRRATIAARFARRLTARELMIGPWALARLRLCAALAAAGVKEPDLKVILEDTLATPPYEPRDPRAALVCLGNPPYDRQQLEVGDGRARKGGFIRHGAPARGVDPLLPAFLPSAGVHAKNLYNDYVYFWRWALWALCERGPGPAVICFVTPSSFLSGPGFSAMRRRLREALDALWILDLGGDGIGARRSANVFSIRTPVCVTLGLRVDGGAPSTPAAARYARLDDALDRGEKLARLAAITGLSDLSWEPCTNDWEGPLTPAPRGDVSAWPRLVDLMPWQHTGIEWKRSWPFAEEQALLERRWAALLCAEDRAAALRVTRDRDLTSRPPRLQAPELRDPPLAALTPGAAPPPVATICHRALDRQRCLADARLGDFLRPTLWRVSGPRQVYLTSSLRAPLSRGPALMAAAHVPDRHHFSGRGGKDVLPLWRDAAATIPNLHAGLRDALARAHRVKHDPEDIFAHLYGLLAHPGYCAALGDALTRGDLRVPLTRDRALFDELAGLGRQLLALHTYGERFGDGTIPRGAARVRRPITQVPERAHHDPATRTLQIGDGLVGPVDVDVWRYEVSGLRVVSSWLGYRLQTPRGRSSSPLDRLRPTGWPAARSQALLELLWVIEGSLGLHARQGPLLEQVLAGPLLRADELPPPAPASRRPP